MNGSGNKRSGKDLPNQVFFCLPFASVWAAGVVVFFLGQTSQAQNSASSLSVSNALPAYQNHRLNRGPWSINVVRVPRAGGVFQVKSAHAQGRALGLGTLTQQTRLFGPESGMPVAAINGDFYQREGIYSGDPRGLQIVEGELISAPNGGVAFWIDAIGDPHCGYVKSKFQVIWPDGTAVGLGLNGTRRGGGLELYTPAIGRSTRTRRGRELVLTQQEKTPWLPLRPGKQYRAVVSEIREAGDTPMPPGALILSMDLAAANRLPRVEVGAELSISTATEPRLLGVRAAVGGGPVLVRDGQKLSLRESDSESYITSSMLERHPRSAIGWNDEFFFLVEVDGRQPGFSEGMSLPELAAYMVQLGCREAMNLDGGGSSTLWFNGRVQNSPCDGNERAIANSLVVVRSPPRNPEPAGNSPGTGEK